MSEKNGLIITESCLIKHGSRLNEGPVIGFVPENDVEIRLKY